MLNVEIRPHRDFLPSDAPEQKLFVMLKLRPTKDIAATRPPTAFSFIIDTSGSMSEVVSQEQTKIAIVIESLLNLVRSGRLDENDRIAIVQFDDRASTLIPLTSATEVNNLEAAIHRLEHFSGGTCMAQGLLQAYGLLSDLDMTVKRALLFTDGETFDEDECREVGKRFASVNIPVTALGVGDDYNEELLMFLSDTTGGSQVHVVPESSIGNQLSIADLPEKLFEDFSQAQQEVITNLALTIKTVADVQLTRAIRVYPSQSEFTLDRTPYSLGNIIANDETIFILELTISNRPAGKVRIAQLGLTYDVPGQNRRGELESQNLIVQFTPGQVMAQVDREVMGYVQQCNISQLVNDATKIAEENPQKAEELLETARMMTQRLGNEAMTQSLTVAQDELRKTHKLSAGTRKTVKIGAKGKTVKMGGDINDELSDAKIREITGT
jgi:Ca-activated chloride channel homolog